MEIVDTRDGYIFKITGHKTFAVLSGNDSVAYCPFCYNQIDFADDKCPFCHKNIPELIYFHGDDQTWIASGNENL
ncbi:MAG: hypothetical protein MJ196_11865 [Treponemataceae bacterium]|nr:hypothetical protein [Treponemataceae bacterium]